MKTLTITVCDNREARELFHALQSAQAQIDSYLLAGVDNADYWENYSNSLDRIANEIDQQIMDGVK